MAFPRKFSTNANYSTGVDVGTPTRVDPGSGAAADGALPHTGLSAQTFNYLMGGLIDALYDLQEQPEEYAEIREDFTGCVFDATTDILHAAYPWQVTSTENAVPGTDPPLAPGTVKASLAVTEEFEMELAGQQLSIRWGDLQDATFRVRVTSTDVSEGEMFVGLAENFELVSVGNNAVGIWFDAATSAQWLVRHKVGGVDDATVTSGTVGSTIWVSLKLHRISATQVECYVFNDLVATLTDGVTAPADSALLTLGMYAKAGATFAMVPEVDMMYVRWSTANRLT